MDKQLSDWLNLKIKDVHTVERLADREKRKNITYSRKQVYLVTLNNKERLVINKFHPNYLTIFQNYCNAHEVISSEFIGRPLKVDHKNLLFTVDYLGDSLKNFNNDHLVKIYKLLSEINKLNENWANFAIPRYFHSLENLNSKNRKFKLGNFNNLLIFLKDNNLACNLGYGTEDPAWANFTELDGKVYLVDLDNFSSKINLDYQIGFLMADADMDFDKILHSSVDTLADKSKHVLNYQGNELFLTIGYIARLTTNLIDYFHNDARSCNLTKINQVVEKLSLDLLAKTLR